MQPLAHNPAAAGIGGQVTANGARGLGVGTAATVEVSALAPAGVDEISATAALSFASEGVQTLGINALAQQEISRAGAAVIASSVAYEATDVAIGTTLI